jgi:hypothetical protein
VENMPTTARLLAVLALLSASAFAANVTITTGSTYAPTDPTSTYSAPSGVWTLTFQVASQPIVTGVTGSTFTTTYTNGVFTLNGTPITLTGSSVTFRNGSGFVILLDSATEFVDNSETTSFYTGSTSSPTMAPGTYPNQYEFLLAQYPSGTTIAFDATSVSYSVVITGSGPATTPAPTSVVLVSIGLAALAVLEMLRRKQAQA